MNKDELKKKYKAIAKVLHKVPNVTDCIAFGISRHMIRHHFGNITNLQKTCGFQSAEQKREDLEKKNIYKMLGVKKDE